MAQVNYDELKAKFEGNSDIIELVNKCGTFIFDDNLSEFRITKHDKLKIDLKKIKIDINGEEEKITYENIDTYLIKLKFIDMKHYFILVNSFKYPEVITYELNKKVPENHVNVHTGEIYVTPHTLDESQKRRDTLIKKMTSEIHQIKDFIINFDIFTAGLNSSEKCEILFDKIKFANNVKNKLEKLNCFHKPFLSYYIKIVSKYNLFVKTETDISSKEEELLKWKKAALNSPVSSQQQRKTTGGEVKREYFPLHKKLLWNKGDLKDHLELLKMNEFIDYDDNDIQDILELKKMIRIIDSGHPREWAWSIIETWNRTGCTNLKTESGKGGIKVITEIFYYIKDGKEINFAMKNFNDKRTPDFDYTETIKKILKL